MGGIIIHLDHKMGFYYNQQPQGFYYDGFYYDKPQEGFYYDQQDAAEHSKFNKENKDYWYKSDGRGRCVTALNGLRTMVDVHVAKNPHAANETQGQALSNAITVEVVREVLKKFIRNVDPTAFFENGGDDKKLATLLIKECQGVLGPEKDFRAAWRKEGPSQKIMDKVSNELVPYMVVWNSKQPFHTPNAVQDAACMKVVAQRLVDECFYEFASKTNPNKIGGGKEKVQKQVQYIAKSLADAALHRVEEDQKQLKN